MGQYHYVVNKTKRQFINPHKMGDGLKLLEFGCSTNGTMTALAVLLAKDNGLGGGDLHFEHELIGSWVGDNIEIAGDYGDGTMSRPALDKKEGMLNLHEYAEEYYEDISWRIREVICQDKWIAKEIGKPWTDRSEWPDSVKKRYPGGP
ncbi:hypothetical protein LCGC14_1927230 [marine sediment metagenome]|uniref:Uncharacterized protein n=1 Tax=marine sediment metagenome TaxID=412755 RepID=A0A0F9FPM7_9ZZZZ